MSSKGSGKGANVIAAALPGGFATIQIQTASHVVQCTADEIERRRFGVNLKRKSIVLEYAVPRLGLRAHHLVEVDIDWMIETGDVPSGVGGDARDAVVATHLLRAHTPWLDGVSVEQLTALVSRILAAGRPEDGRPRRPRLQIVPETARASKTTKEADVQRVFETLAVGDSGDAPSLDDLRGFVCDHLGFGLAEADAFATLGGGGGLGFAGFRELYWTLNPFMVQGRSREVIIRKHGSLGGLQPAYTLQQINLEELEDCEVYVCTSTAQAFVDACKRCVILVGPCESSIFVRDCEDCVIWLACQQLRTRDCKRCTFHLYAKTEPIIETSEDLAFAPWCARYPGCSAQFSKAGFNPARNFWSAVFDFNGEVGRSHWRILPLDEVTELAVDLDEAPHVEPDNPCASPTHAALCAAPLQAEDSSGQGVAAIPQTRPAPPPEAGDAKPRCLRVREGVDRRPVGASRLGGC